MSEFRHVKNSLKGLVKGKNFTINLAEASKRALNPKIDLNQQILFDARIQTSTSNETNYQTRRMIEILQLGSIEKCITGEVELLGFRRSNAMVSIAFLFNTCSVGDFEIRRGHPLRNEFIYLVEERSPRAVFAEFLGDCRDRNVRVIVPGVLHFRPDNCENSLGVCNVYADIPSYYEINSYLGKFGF